MAPLRKRRTADAKGSQENENEIQNTLDFGSNPESEATGSENQTVESEKPEAESGISEGEKPAQEGEGAEPARVVVKRRRIVKKSDEGEITLLQILQQKPHQLLQLQHKNSRLQHQKNIRNIKPLEDQYRELQTASQSLQENQIRIRQKDHILQNLILYQMQKWQKMQWPQLRLHSRKFQVLQKITQINHVL